MRPGGQGLEGNLRVKAGREERQIYDWYQRHGAAAAAHPSVAARFSELDALVDGLVERLQERTDQDSTTMRDAPQGAAAYYITSSTEVDTPFDRTFLAVFRLAAAA